jgi:peptidyl-Asp metalloendopeptidase
MTPSIPHMFKPWRLLVAGTAALGASIVMAAGPALFVDQTPARNDTLPPRAMAEAASEGRLNPQALAAGQLRLLLPDGREWVAERRKEVRGLRGERTWVGEFKGIPGSLMTLTSYRGFVNGFVHHGGETWEIESSGPGRSNLYRVDESRFAPEGPIQGINAAGDATLGASTTSSTVTPSGDWVTQDLLVVYTPAAANANGGPAGLETKIHSAVAAANAAYGNSVVNVRLNVVGLSQLAYTETGDMGLTLGHLRTPGDGFMDDVHALRDSVGADLVALISNDTNYCGIAYLMTGVNSGFASYAFSVTQPGCFAGHTLAHEIGHNQGNAHDRANGSSAAYPYSYGYRTCDHPELANGQSFRTVMAYSCTATPRVNHFSNPHIHYNNAAPMGIAYEADPAKAADNVRSMNNTAATIAAFRSGSAGVPPAAPSQLTGSALAFDRVQLGWTDNASDETGFVVQRAVNGGTYADRITLGSNVAAFTDSGVSGNTSYSYRVRAYNSAGASAYSNAVTVLTPAAPPAPVAPTPAALSLAGSNAMVTWANVANESSYEIRRETYNSRKATWSATLTSAPADSTVLTQTLAAGTYRYSVRAIGAGGLSPWATVTCSACAADGTFTLASTGGKAGGGKR